MKLIFLLIILVNLVFSQNPSKGAIELSIGQMYYNKVFNTGIPVIENGFINAPPYSLTLSIDDYRLLISKNISIENISMSYTQVIPYSVIVGAANLKITGFTFRQSVGVDLFKKVKWFALNLGAGYAVGRTKLYGDKSLNQKNQFFKPEAGIQPRLLIGDLTLSCSAFYGMDISSSHWKKMWFNKAQQVEVKQFKQGGLFVCVGFGLRIGSKVLSSSGSKV